MNDLMKWVLFAIFIYGAFSSNETQNPKEVLQLALVQEDEEIINLLLNNNEKAEETEKLFEYVMKEGKHTALHVASANGNEKNIRLLLNVFGKNENEKLIEYVMKENKYKETVLHQGHEEIAKLLLNAFSEDKNKKLIEFIMSEDEFKNTDFHHVSYRGHEKIVESLLNAFISEGCKNNKLINYVVKENKYCETALHNRGHGKIVKLLLNIFSVEDQHKLIEYLMKEDQNKNTALHDSSVKDVTKFLLHAFFSKEENEKFIEYVTKENKYKETFDNTENETKTLENSSKLQRQMINEEDPSCVICLQPFEFNNGKFKVEIIDKTFINVHKIHDSDFHKGCIRKWMENNNSCPICRKTLKQPWSNQVQMKNKNIIFLLYVYLSCVFFIKWIHADIITLYLPLFLIQMLFLNRRYFN